MYGGPGTAALFAALQGSGSDIQGDVGVVVAPSIMGEITWKKGEGRTGFQPPHLPRVGAVPLESEAGVSRSSEAGDQDEDWERDRGWCPGTRRGPRVLV